MLSRRIKTRTGSGSLDQNLSGKNSPVNKTLKEYLSTVDGTAAFETLTALRKFEHEFQYECRKIVTILHQIRRVENLMTQTDNFHIVFRVYGPLVLAKLFVILHTVLDSKRVSSCSKDCDHSEFCRTKKLIFRPIRHALAEMIYSLLYATDKNVQKGLSTSQILPDIEQTDLPTSAVYRPITYLEVMINLLNDGDQPIYLHNLVAKMSQTPTAGTKTHTLALIANHGYVIDGKRRLPHLCLEENCKCLHTSNAARVRAAMDIVQLISSIHNKRAFYARHIVSENSTFILSKSIVENDNDEFTVEHLPPSKILEQLWSIVQSVVLEKLAWKYMVIKHHVAICSQYNVNDATQTEKEPIDSEFLDRKDLLNIKNQQSISLFIKSCSERIRGESAILMDRCTPIQCCDNLVHFRVLIGDDF